jgi:hypothetical protein
MTAFFPDSNKEVVEYFTQSKHKHIKKAWGKAIAFRFFESYGLHKILIYKCILQRSSRGSRGYTVFEYTFSIGSR